MILFVIFLISLIVLFVATNGNQTKTIVQSIKEISDFILRALIVDREVDEVEDKKSIPDARVEKEEVFHVPNQLFTYEEAKLFCKQLGVRMANLNDLKRAYLKGASWMTMGWTDNQLGLYILQPRTVRRYPEAGNVGINGGYFENAKLRMGINCYGVKPKPDPKRIEIAYSDLQEVDGASPFERESTTNEAVADYMAQLKSGDIVISPWNTNKWSVSSKVQSKYHLHGIDVGSNRVVNGTTDELERETEREWVKKQRRNRSSNSNQELGYSQAAANLNETHMRAIFNMN